MSGGERRRVALCRLLMSDPDMLLLDEPTNHLDAESIAWLERFLKEFPGTVVAITHDRYFLDNVAGWILELDRGEGIPYKGNYSGWLEQKSARLKNEAKSDDKRLKTLERELEWIKMSPKGRQSKSKSRINAYENLLNQEEEKIAKEIKLYIPPGPRLGNVVIQAKDVSKKFGFFSTKWSKSLNPATLIYSKTKDYESYFRSRFRCQSPGVTFTGLNQSRLRSEKSKLFGVS